MTQHTTTQPARASWPKRHPILTGVAVVFGILVAFGACSGTSTNSPSARFSALPTNNPESDVKITECGGADQFGLSKVSVRITNSTDRVLSLSL